MRAALLLLLGGCLVWFVWRSLEPEKSAQDEAQAASPGTMLPPAPPAAPESLEPAKTPEKQAEKPRESLPTPHVETAHAPAPAPTPAAAPAREPESRPRAEQAPASSAEADLAAAMIRNPANFAGAVQEKAGNLAAGRKQLALALAKALAGADAEARTLLEALDGDVDVRASERDFVRRVIEHKTSGVEPAAAPAVAGNESPLVLAATLVLEAREAESLAKSGRHRDAARLYSALLLQEVAAPWRADPEVLGTWTQGLRAEQRHHRWSKTGEWPSIPVKVEKGDSLTTVRKRVLEQHSDLLVYTGLLDRANELGGGVIQPGQTLRVPTDRVRMQVDLSAHWAFFLMGEEVAAAWPVGVGKEGSETKVGRYSVGEKTREPMWFPPGRSPVPFGDSENPLGTRWIAWIPASGAVGTGPKLGFHGTKDPGSIGKDLSQGCIRMRNEDVEELFEILPKGAEIVVEP